MSHAVPAKKPEMRLASVGFSGERGESNIGSAKYSVDAEVTKFLVTFKRFGMAQKSSLCEDNKFVSKSALK